MNPIRSRIDFLLVLILFREKVSLALNIHHEMPQKTKNIDHEIS